MAGPHRRADRRQPGAGGDLDYGEFFNRGGRLGAQRALGAEWLALVGEMNEALAV